MDVEGRLLGLNALRLEGGLILAVPASAAVKARDRRASRAARRPPPPRLGVAVAPPRAARRMRRAVGLPERDGLLVRAVEDGSPAAAAGIEAGDLLVAAGDAELGGVDALYEVLDALPADGGAGADRRARHRGAPRERGVRDDARPRRERRGERRRRSTRPRPRRSTPTRTR